MDYKKIYTEHYFSGRDSFFYSLGYGRFQNYYFGNLYKSLKPYLRHIKNGNILDVGCAYGFMLERFPKRFKKYGLDISKHAISEAKKRNPDAKFKIGGAEDPFPYPKNSFDIVLSNDLIEHVEHPQKVLKNIMTVLKPGGILYINTPNLNWIRRTFVAFADRKEHHISLFHHDELYELLKKQGFKVIKRWTYVNALYFGAIKLHKRIAIESAFVCRKKA